MLSAQETPTYSETIQVVAHALLETREDNRCLPAEMRAEEDTFCTGAIRLFMGEDRAPIGQALPGMVKSIQRQVGLWTV